MMILMGFGFQAQGATFQGLVPTECKTGSLTTCNLTVFEETVINIVTFALGISGSLALVALVAGGLMYIAGGAKPDMLKKAKDTIVYAIIGLLIVLGGGIILKVVISAIATQ